MKERLVSTVDGDTSLDLAGDDVPTKQFQRLYLAVRVRRAASPNVFDDSSYMCSSQNRTQLVFDSHTKMLIVYTFHIL